MLMSYDELKKLRLVYTDAAEDSHEVSDILIDGDTGSVVNIVYEDRQVEHNEDAAPYANQSVHMFDAMGSGAAGNTSNIPQAEGLPPIQKAPVQYFFIDAKEAIIKDDKIHYEGPVKGEREAKQGLVSLREIIGDKLVTEEDNDIGKIKDIYLNVENMTVRGLKLSEGFWDQLVGGGYKYLPVDAILKWYPAPVIVRESAKELLLDEPGELEEI